MVEMVDFRDQVSKAIGDLKWMEDVCKHTDGPSRDELAEFARIAEDAKVVIRILIWAGLKPAGLWGMEADELWIRPASEWPAQKE